MKVIQDQEYICLVTVYSMNNRWDVGEVVKVKEVDQDRIVLDNFGLEYIPIDIFVNCFDYYGIRTKAI